MLSRALDIHKDVKRSRGKWMKLKKGGWQIASIECEWERSEREKEQREIHCTEISFDGINDMCLTRECSSDSMKTKTSFSGAAPRWGKRNSYALVDTEMHAHTECKSSSLRKVFHFLGDYVLQRKLTSNCVRSWFHRLEFTWRIRHRDAETSSKSKYVEELI